jgi:hypothetical protein
VYADTKYPNLTMEQFIWHDPLFPIFKSKRNSNDIFYAYLDYLRQLKSLEIIWNRYHKGLAICKSFDEFQSKLMEEQNGERILTSNEVHEMKAYEEAKYSLQLDHESFIIYARILMNKASKLAQVLLEDYNLESNSFNDQKKELFKPHNRPYRNENYAKLVRDETHWFDISLRSYRDDLIMHTVPRIHVVVQDSLGNYRFLSLKSIGGSVDKQQELILLKAKYEEDYPGLKSLNNLQEIIHYIKNHDVKLGRDDIVKFNRTVQSTGGALPEVRYIAEKILMFIEGFAKAFGY